MILYLETSAAIKVLVRERGSDAALAALGVAERILSSRVTYPETRAALAAAHRAGRLSNAGLSRATLGARGLLDEMEIVELDAPVAWLAGDLAERFALRGFDAVHLASAMAVDGATIATWDRDLIRAADRAGLAVVNG